LGRKTLLTVWTLCLCVAVAAAIAISLSGVHEGKEAEKYEDWLKSKGRGEEGENGGPS
jgi:hypothetical protein